MASKSKSSDKHNFSNAIPAKVYMPMNQAKFQPFAYRQQQQKIASQKQASASNSNEKQSITLQEAQ